jgi:Cu-processing system ATP-binding protein
VIRVEGLTKRFGDVTVLRALDIEISRGRITAIVGPNAAGKTTLIKTMLGLTRPDSGSVSIDGITVNGDEQYRRDIGYMPQSARFPENMCPAELFQLVRELRGTDDATFVDEELVDAFGLRALATQPLRLMSGGTRQKVNAALAFLFAPSLLILDEPTAGLDPVSSSILKDKILGMRVSGHTVIVTSHIMSELEELADDVAVLVEGTAHFVGPMEDLKRRTRQPTLERAVANLLVRRVAA